jgi:hypothetical protein
MKITPEVKRFLRESGMTEQLTQIAESMETPPDHVDFDLLQKIEAGDLDAVAFVEEEAERAGVTKEQFVGIIKAIFRRRSRGHHN